MTNAHAAALAIARESLEMLHRAVDGLPPEALSWTPAPGTNSIAVLTMHGLTATRFFFKVACGEIGSLAEYRAGDRAEAFATAGGTAFDLQAEIDACLPELEEILSKGRPEHLEPAISWPEDPNLVRTGYGFLINTLAHLREHVGQAQLMRDLWLARPGNG
jgi:hypothetical protein